MRPAGKSFRAILVALRDASSGQNAFVLTQSPSHSLRIAMDILVAADVDFTMNHTEGVLKIFSGSVRFMTTNTFVDHCAHNRYRGLEKDFVKTVFDDVKLDRDRDSLEVRWFFDRYKDIHHE